jgi:hypothetical protein
MESHSFVGKHEPAFIHEEGQLSYDPTVYSSSYQDRFHIKTLDVSHLLPKAVGSVLHHPQLCRGPTLRYPLGPPLCFGSTIDLEGR